jgi:hypothetical protein
MDPGLGAIHVGAKVTQLGAVDVGAKPAYHLADDAELALTWQHLGAVIRDENGTDIFRPYSRPNPFRGVLIRPYPSPDI